MTPFYYATFINEDEERAFEVQLVTLEDGNHFHVTLCRPNQPDQVVAFSQGYIADVCETLIAVEQTALDCGLNPDYRVELVGLLSLSRVEAAQLAEVCGKLVKLA